MYLKASETKETELQPATGSDIVRILQVAEQEKYTQTEKVLGDLKYLPQKLEKAGSSEQWLAYATLIYDIYVERQSINEALQILTDIHKNQQKQFTEEQAAEVELMIAVLHNKLGEPHRANEIYDRLEPQLHDSLLLASIYANRANIQMDNGSYDQSLRNLINAQRILEKGDNLDNLINVTNNIGLVYRLINDNDNAASNMMKAAEMLPGTRNPHLALMVYGNLGIIFKEKGDYEKAMEYYLEALENAVKLGNPNQEARMLMNIGNIYHGQGKAGDALRIYHESLRLCYTHNIGYGIILNYINIGNAEKSRRNFSSALAALDSAHARISGQQLSNELSNLYLLYSEVYEEAGNSALALSNYKKYHELYIEMFNKERDNALSELRIRYETEIKDRQLVQYGLREEQQKSRIRLLISISLVVVLLFLTIFLILIYRNRRLHELYERNLELIKNPLEFRDLTEKPGNSASLETPLYNSLLEVLRTREMYRSEDLRIEHLATILGVKDKELSQTIQDMTGMSYRQFIGYYRVRQACRMLLEDGQGNRINEVMYDCGFSSRTTFHNTFKKHTGMSPSQFKNQANK